MGKVKVDHMMRTATRALLPLSVLLAFTLTSGAKHACHVALPRGGVSSICAVWDEDERFSPPALD